MEMKTAEDVKYVIGVDYEVIWLWRLKTNPYLTEIDVIVCDYGLKF